MTEAKQQYHDGQQQPGNTGEDVVTIIAERVHPVRGCELRVIFFGDTPKNNKRWWEASDVASSFPRAYAKWRNSVIPDEKDVCKWLPLLFLRQIGILLEVNLLMTIRGGALLLCQLVMPVLVIIAMQLADSGTYSLAIARDKPFGTPRVVPDPVPCHGDSCASVVFAPPNLNPSYVSTLQEVAARSNLRFEDFVPLQRPLLESTHKSQTRREDQSWCIGRSKMSCPGPGCPGCVAHEAYPQLPDRNSCNLPEKIQQLSREAAIDSNSSSPFVPLLLPCVFFRDLDLLSMRMENFTHVQHALQLTGQYVHDAFAAMVTESTFEAQSALKSELMRLGVDDGYVLWLNTTGQGAYPNSWQGEQSMALKRVIDEVIMLRKFRTFSESNGFMTSDVNLSVHVKWAPYPTVTSTDEHFVSNRYGAIFLILPIMALFCSLSLNLTWEHTSGMLVYLECMGLLPLVRLSSWMLTGAMLSLVSAIVTCVWGGVAGVPFFANAAASSVISLFSLFGVTVTAWCLCLAAIARRLPGPLDGCAGTPWVVAAMFVQLLSACSLPATPSLLSSPSSSLISGLSACSTWAFPPFHFARGYGEISSQAYDQSGHTVAVFGLSRLQTELPSLGATLGNMVAVTIFYFLLAACVETFDLIGYAVRSLRVRYMNGGVDVTPLSRECGRECVQLHNVTKHYRGWRRSVCGRVCMRCCPCVSRGDALALRDVSLTLDGDEVVAVMGTNGAGEVRVVGWLLCLGGLLVIRMFFGSIMLS